MQQTIISRYNQTSSLVLRGLGYLAPRQLRTKDAIANIMKAAEWYRDDLDLYDLKLQLLLLQNASFLDPDATLIDLYRIIRGEGNCYSNFVILIKLALSLPVTSCSAERSFSKLKIVKSRLRTTMNQDRLNSLMIMSSESDIREKLDLNVLIEKFSSASARRMMLY